MSSSKKVHSDAAGKKSVFERLGSKSSTEDYCKQWAHKGSCSYLTKCKFIETHTSKYYKGSSSSGKEGKKRSRSRSRSPLKKEKSKTKSPTKPTSKSSKSADGDSGDWEKSLDQEDELALERKLQMLQRELAKQEEQEHKGKLKKPVAKKRERSSSSSSTSSSTSSGSSSDSSASSSSSSSGTTTTSSSVTCSSDSDGEVKDKKYGKKKVRKEVKRSHSSSSRNLSTREKSKAKAKKVAKLSPSIAAKKKDGLSSGKKLNRTNMSPKRQHTSSSAAKHRETSPSFPQRIRSRSPRLKEPSELPNRDRRMRRSPETGSENKRKLPLSTHPPLRRRTDESSPPPRERPRDGKPLAKMDKPRDRLLESGYIGRTRSPYRDSYAVRDASPTGSAYRDRLRAEPYDSRRGYSPTPTKLDRNKEDLYDARPRRPVSPEATSLRRPVGSRPKDYHEYDHDWQPVTEPTKVNEWDHSDHRRRNRQLDDVNWNRASGSAGESSWKKSYCSPPIPGFLPARDSANKRDRERRIDRPRELISRRPAEPAKMISPAPPTEEIEDASVAVVKTEETIADDVRPASSAIDADEVENFSDFSDDVDEILNRDLQAQDSDSLKTEEEGIVPAESETNNGEFLQESELKVIVEPTAQFTGEVQASPKVLSPPASGIESRSTDEDLLGGMDIEQVSDEELEDESKAAPVDALEVDWASLACKREKKTDSGVQGARQRWEGKAVLARLGIISSLDGKQPSTIPEKKSLFDCSNLFRRALSARMDLSLRRSLCNLPVRELVLMEHFDDDLNLFKASVDLMFKERNALTN